MRSLPAAALLLASPALTAQSFNLDFGPASSIYGAPDASYGAAGFAGHWHTVGPAGGSLVDTAGKPTGVQLTFGHGVLAVECEQSGTSGNDEALLDDRLQVPALGHGSTSLRLSGLETGHYRIRLYSTLPTAPCGGGWPDEILVRVDNAWMHIGLNWDGAFEVGETHSHHFAHVDAGEDLVLHVEGWSYFAFHMSGLQLERSDHLVPYCYGDGSASACPCGNEAAAGAGCANSTGSGGRLAALGSTSVSAADLAFTAHDLPPGQPALLFAGTDLIAGGRGMPFGDGLVCTGGGLVRLGVSFADAGGGAAWGAGLGGPGGFAAGDTRSFQVWYRNPGGQPCGTGFNLTQAIQAYFVP